MGDSARASSPRAPFAPPNDRELWLVAAIVLLGLLLRLYYAWRTNQHLPDGPARLTGDEPGYDGLARDLVAGAGYTYVGRVPLYPLWLVLLKAATGGSYAAVPYIQSLLGIVPIWMTWVVARELGGARAGLLAALLVALDYVLAQHAVRFLSEILYTPFVLAIVLSLTRSMDEPRPGRFARTGVWVGLSDLVRPTLLAFPAFLVLLLPLRLGLRRGVRMGVVCGLAALAVVAPWIVRNYVRYNAVMPLAPSNAILWQGSPEYYHLVRDSGYTYMRVWREKIYGPGWQAHDPMSPEGDAWWTARALRSIRAEPGTYLRYAGEKALTYWIGDPEADWAGPPFSYRSLIRAGWKPTQAIPAMACRALIFLALAAALVLRRRWRELLPIYSVALYATLLHAATHAEARLSEPLQPLLIVLVATAAAELLARAQSRRYWVGGSSSGEEDSAGGSPGIATGVSTG